MRLRALSILAVVSASAFSCANGRFYNDKNSEDGDVGVSGGTVAHGGVNSSGGSSGGALNSSGGAMMSGGASNSSGGAANGGMSSGGTAGASGSNGSGGNAGSGSASGGLGRGGSANGGSAGNSSKGGAGGGSAGGNANKGGSSSSGGTQQGQGGASSTGTVTQPPAISGGSNAWASRYWDCCKPACGWKGNVKTGNPMTACSKDNQPLGDVAAKNACESGGSAYMCWSGAPWSVSDTLSLGFAAASGPNYVCGRCFQVQFNGQGHNGSPASSQLNGKTMIIQVINNGGVQQDQFDLLVPGGGVGALNACSTQWGSSDLGSQYGGFLAGCNGDKNCVKNKCQTVFAGKADLQAGCDWFLNWYGAADNPSFVYKQIACPSAITQKSGLSDPG